MVAVSLFSVLAAPVPAGAVPITYVLRSGSPAVSGSLAGAPFSNADVTITFDGDTDDVIPFSVPGASGFELLRGSACVEAVSGGAPSFIAGFRRSAHVYVSADNTNSGLGIGSAGVLPSDPTFPGQPVYPVGMVSSFPGVSTYDLKSGGFAALGIVLSCAGFPAACQSGLALPTGLGDLVIDNFTVPGGIFLARTHDETPFASFRAEAEWSGPTAVTVEGSFTLGAASNGIDLVNDFTTVQIGCYQAFTSGFTANPDGSFSTLVSESGGTFRMRVVPRAGGRYKFRIRADSPILLGNANPALTVVTIGDDAGRARIEVEH
jgi:hypothetical protein